MSHPKPTHHPTTSSQPAQPPSALVLSIALCIGAVHYSFSGLMELQYTLLALIFAALLSIMGVRALGETDLNPVSGISKLTQLLFALIVPRANKNTVVINLVAGALSESGALQAGDLMQDLKAGHLLGAAPRGPSSGARSSGPPSAPSSPPSSTGCTRTCTRSPAACSRFRPGSFGSSPRGWSRARACRRGWRNGPRAQACCSR